MHEDEVRMDGPVDDRQAELNFSRSSTIHMNE